MTHPTHPDRVLQLNGLPPGDGEYVLYWMQQSQRARHNPALEYAVERANELDLPLVVGFGLTPDYPDANLRHYRFMLQGLQDASQALADRGIKMVVRVGPPTEVALELAANAAAVVCDRGYLRHQREWRDQVAEDAACEVVEVDADVVVPVETVSDKQEYAARTIRPKLMKVYEDYLALSDPIEPSKESLGLAVSGLDLSDLTAVEKKLDVPDNVKPVDQFFTGGTTAAEEVFNAFLRNRFCNYSKNRNQPQTNDVSHVSKYLHFGQISPVWLLLEARQKADADNPNLEDFTEELLVRRELAVNYVWYTPDYDDFSSLPDWALDTLDAHKDDQREYTYSLSELDAAATHDEYWNAAMQEMKHTGYMHNYMRMYWGKKILEWSPSPQEAFERTLHLNNKYFLDGRDPVSYASVAWVFGRHDRPWKERPIFGKVRYMNARGLERKCDIADYVEKVAGLV